MITAEQIKTVVIAVAAIQPPAKNGTELIEQLKAHGGAPLLKAPLAQILLALTVQDALELADVVPN